MKLIIQIPSFNESEQLPDTIAALPKQIEGIDHVETLIIDDGSTDNTAKAALNSGVDHLVVLPHHSGLAKAYAAGLDACLKLGADIIVNTDADNQYEAKDISKLIKPILNGDAELVIGDRGVSTNKNFSFLKRKFQQIGSRIVSGAAGFSIPDATSGFRALTKELALRTNVLSAFSYTLETLIQAGEQRAKVVFVPVSTNPIKRPSRLHKNSSHFILFSSASILRAYTLYRPLRIFIITGMIPFLIGILLGTRFLIRYWSGNGTGNIQSLILAAILLIIGIMIFVMGIIADLIGFNRKLLEDILYRIKKDQN